jgi:hypothetical protein
MAARIDFCPHGREVGSHGTANRPHGLNFRRTDGKMAARNEFSPHGEGECPHRPVSRLREAIFARTKRFEGCMAHSVAIGG